MVSGRITPGSPRMSSYLDYLVQDHEKGFEITYNDEFKLRGVKQYWLHEDVSPAKADKEKVASYFKALDKNSRFEGKVHFKNLTKAELGLLLWSLDLGKDKEQNIGHGKAYGYGRISISQPKIQIYDFSKMYGDSLTLDIYSETNLQANECIAKFWEELAGKLHIMEPGAVQQQNSIRQFLAMKDTAHMPKEEQIRYMSIDNKEYQSRQYALGTVDDVLAGKPGAKIKRENKDQKGNGQKTGKNSFQGRQDGTIGYLKAKKEPKGETVEGEVIEYDKRKQQLCLQVGGKEIRIGMNPFEALSYGKKKKIILKKNGNDYSVKK